MTGTRPAGHEVRVAAAAKRFGGTTALAQVSFDVTPGELLVLLGPSGSGKSTLVRCLAGVERLDSGTIHLGGQRVADGPRQLPPERRNLAMVFQDYALWPHLTVSGNVEYALRRRRCGPQESRRRVARTLERVGLGAHGGRYPHQLSGGEQQRVALARAIVAEPGLLLFDEPLSNLDADLRERLRVEIATLTRESEATAVYITHDQSEAFALADRIGVLDRGTLAQLATPEDIYHRPATPFVARFTGTAGQFTGTVRSRRGRVAEVALGPDVLSVRVMDDAGVGSHCEVYVRPEAARIIGGPAATTLPGRLTGTVVDVAYRGRGYDHVIRCGQGTLAAVRAPRPCSRGEQVHVSIDPDHCFAFHSQDHSSEDGNLTAVTSPGAAPLALAGRASPRRNA